MTIYVCVNFFIREDQLIIVPGGGGRVFAPFWSEHFAHFGLESSVVFEGTTGVYERILVSIPKGCGENEKHANSKWI